MATGVSTAGDDWRCTWCGYVYEPARGDPDRGIVPGTPWDSLPESWCCPDCRAPQADFVADGAGP